MTFTDFFNLSNIHFIISIFISIINAVLLIFIARKFLQILQISGYKIRGYQIWLGDTKAKYISRIALLCFLSLACVLVTNALFDVYNQDMFYSYFGLIFYIYFSIVFIINMDRSPQKTPLVQTRRMSRLTTLLFLVSFVITLILIWFSSSLLPFLRFGIVAITPVLLPVLVPLCHFVLIPLEMLIRLRYIKKAKKKLSKRNDLIKIGITGSFGKTSVKHILNVMLSKKYNVCMTPHSFNTPMGLTKVVLKYLKEENNLLIAEMGAKQVGDIDYLCKLIQPQHGVITGIGSQHYETFGSKENIIKTKNELILNLPENGFAVFNCETDGAQQMYDNCTLKNKFAVSLNSKNSVVVAKNTKINENGLEFTLCYNNEQVDCKTNLLGRHNLSNILVSSCLALKLGVSLKQIAESISLLESIPHRLELINSGNTIILDDAYSSNEQGAKAAVETLAQFKNRVKICVTPGIVELGDEEKRINSEFGSSLAGICDYVIIVNKINADSIKEGLLKSQMDSNNIIQVDTLNDAKLKLQEIIDNNKKYAILFENDLPDNYT